MYQPSLVMALLLWAMLQGTALWLDPAPPWPIVQTVLAKGAGPQSRGLRPAFEQVSGRPMAFGCRYSSLKGPSTARADGAREGRH